MKNYTLIISEKVSITRYFLLTTKILINKTVMNIQYEDGPCKNSFCFILREKPFLFFNVVFYSSFKAAPIYRLLPNSGNGPIQQNRL